MRPTGGIGIAWDSRAAVTVEDVGLWTLRAIGALYLLGGLFGMRQAFFWGKLEPQMDQLLDMLDGLDADRKGESAPPARVTDNNRNWWLFAGAVLLAVSGGAMLVGHRSAAALLALLVIQQMAYFIRQRRMELRAQTAEHAEEARPERSTVNAFFGSLAVALLAAWLFHRGVLL